MSAERTVRFHLDFISPYTWLALMRSESFAAEHRIRWQVRPVVYAVLLEAHGLVGPAESPAKRRYTFRDVLRCARAAGLRFRGPPAHPFRSLEALRTLWAFRDEPAALRLAVGLADACWGRGRPLTDLGVIREVVGEVGLDAEGLGERIAAPEIKLALRRATAEAVASGIFGVPTFVLDGELFWGHDRLEQLARRLAGEAPPPDDELRAVLSRPGAARRRGAPPSGS